MARLLVVNFVSLDGVIESPLSDDEGGPFARGGWVASYSDDAVAEHMQRVTTGAAGLVLGRRTYEIFRAAWAEADEANPAVAAMNRMPKYVATRAPEPPTAWGPTERLGDPAAELPDVKRRTEGDLVVFGSGGLIPDLAAHDLVDEYQLLLYPLLVGGGGRRLFGADGPLTRFDLTAATPTPAGVVILTYARPDDARPDGVAR